MCNEYYVISTNIRQTEERDTWQALVSYYVRRKARGCEAETVWPGDVDYDCEWGDADRYGCGLELE
jgi:hypothetical protein